MPFVKASELQYLPRLVVSVEGQPKTGKTTFALTAPRPARVFNIDFGLEGLDYDRRGVMVADYSMGKAANFNAEDAVARSKQVIETLHDDWRTFLERRSRTTGIIDTASDLWQIFRMAYYGLAGLKFGGIDRHRYAEGNRAFRGLLNEIYQSPHNLILAHRVKAQFDNAAVLEREGFREIEYFAQVIIRTWRKKRKGNLQFGFTVVDCRQRPTLQGMTFAGEIAQFGYLGMEVFPTSNPKDWGLE